MAITVIFELPRMSAAQYDRALKQLEAKGEGAPKGRLYHVASPSQDGWYVLDVWDSPENLDRFGKVLMPILSGVGVQPPVPKVLPTHNIIKG